MATISLPHAFKSEKGALDETPELVRYALRSGESGSNAR